jgi:hypothetical protein
MVECPPYPVRRARQALDRLGVADLASLDRAEQGKELIQLHLCDPHVMQEVARKGGGVVRHFHEPRQHRVRVHLKHPGHGTNAKSFGQRAHGPHQFVE